MQPFTEQHLDLVVKAEDRETETFCMLVFVPCPSKIKFSWPRDNFRFQMRRPWRGKLDVLLTNDTCKNQDQR